MTDEEARAFAKAHRLIAYRISETPAPGAPLRSEIEIADFLHPVVRCRVCNVEMEPDDWEGHLRLAHAKK